MTSIITSPLALTNFACTCMLSKVNSMQRKGTVAIRTQIQPLKPKREITKITNNQNTKRTHGQPSGKPPGDFPIFSALTAAFIPSRRIGRGFSSGICGQSSTVGPHQSHS